MRREVKNLEKHFVIFEMMNGESHKYELENTNVENVYQTMNSSPDGWIEFMVKGETHYLSADKVVRVRITPQSVRNQRSENTAKAFQGFR